MMSNEEEKRCPLCAEEMDWTDQQLKPCKCGYQVCVWCWNHIIDMAEKNETEGQCPACRKIYEKEKIVAMQASCERMGNKTVSRKNKPPKAKPKINEAKKDLTNVRVIQRKMAYVIGLPLSLADEDLLLQKEYFGQYGKITKVSLSRNASGAIQQFINDTCSVYITYSKEEEALRCIQSVHGFVLEGRDLRASFGTAKYCHAWLKNTPCNNPSCLYLHSIGDEKDSFGKDEVAAVHTRSRVQQIVGAANNQLRRSGSVLPSPVDCNSSSADTDDTSTGRSAMIDAAHGSVNSNSDITFTVPFNHKEGVPAPNKMTSFVDIVGQANFSCPVKDEIIPEDGNLGSKLSSVTINGDLYAGVPYSVAKTSKVSSNHLGIGFCLEEQLKDIPDEPFTEGSLSYDNQGSKGSCSTQRDCFHQQPYPASILEDSCLPTLFHKKFHILSDLNADHNAVNNYEDEASLPFRCVNSVLNDGCHEMKLPSFAKSDRIYRNSSSFSNEEIVEHLRRIDDDNLTNNEESSALDAVESSIISNIMSMDFDSCDDSLRLTNASSELLAETDGLRGSSWTSLNGIQSGFSYPEQANQVAGAVLPDFRDKKERYLCMPQYRATRPQSLAPPGFSVPSRDPPPGFSSCERIGSLPRASSGSCLVSASNTWLQMPSTGFSSATRDVDFTDPALFSSSKGKPANRLNNSGLEMGLARTQQLSAYKDDPFWLLMQQSASANQPSNISQMFTPQTPYPRQEMSYAACTENGLSTLDDIYGLSSRMVDHQHQSHNPSSFSRLSQQKYANGQSLNTNGYLQSLDEVRRRNEVDVIELQRNERIGVNDYFTGYEDLSFSPGDVYSRVFGM